VRQCTTPRHHHFAPWECAGCSNSQYFRALQYMAYMCVLALLTSLPLLSPLAPPLPSLLSPLSPPLSPLSPLSSLPTLTSPTSPASLPSCHCHGSLSHLSHLDVSLTSLTVGGHCSLVLLSCTNYIGNMSASLCIFQFTFKKRCRRCKSNNSTSLTTPAVILDRVDPDAPRKRVEIDALCARHPIVSEHLICTILVRERQPIVTA